MTETEAFKEFKQGLALLRDNYADRALAHMQRAACERRAEKRLLACAARPI